MRNFKKAILFSSVLALAACQQGGVRDDGTSVVGSSTPRNPAKSMAQPAVPVEQRATERWEALIAGNGEKAFTYLTPGTQEVLDLTEYAQGMRQRPVKWVNITYLDKECTADSCNVKLQLTYKVNVPVMSVGEVESVTILVERWLLSDGMWYHLPNQS